MKGSASDHFDSEWVVIVEGERKRWQMCMLVPVGGTGACVGEVGGRCVGEVVGGCVGGVGGE